MSRFQFFFLGVVAGGLVLYTFGLASMNVLLSSGVRIIALIVAFALCILLVWMIARVMRWVFAKSDTKVWLKLLCLTGALVLAFIVVAAILDVSLGTGFRVWLSLDAVLPAGNLFVAGGRAGWAYLTLILLFCETMLYGKVAKHDKIAGVAARFKGFHQTLAGRMRKTSQKEHKAERIFPSP